MTNQLDHKYLRVTMPDGSKWEIPMSVIATNKGENHEYEGVDNIEECIHLAMHESDESLIDWAENDMNWSEVADHAQMVEQGTVDYEDGWTNGDKEVIVYD
ncbi:hypothetical protein [Paenibacillus xylaniclasticus]|uniref:hypothetical protein n=1 Tax=Paenibacillus xylaniclasticus TaxID=588083 RepID=UPI000FD772E4|nr:MULTISPECIES: hypothetical protein [Paenibacillus]GFN32560.1 hypothetical protein PCURB6_28200 [Paenibacillus curdlanolyticus]